MSLKLIPALIAIATFALLSPVLQSSEKYRQGVMVDSGEYDWCHYDCAPFDRPTFFFCVQVDHQILIGSRKADWKWEYDSSQMLGFRGKTISLRYDDGSMWIIRTDGKDMHLTQDYSRNVFTRPECVAELHRHWLQQFNQIKRPDAVPAEKVCSYRKAHKHF